MVRGRYGTAEAGARTQYSTWCRESTPPCAAGTYPTRQAGRRSLYVPPTEAPGRTRAVGPYASPYP